MLTAQTTPGAGRLQSGAALRVDRRAETILSPARSCRLRMDRQAAGRFIRPQAQRLAVERWVKLSCQFSTGKPVCLGTSIPTSAPGPRISVRDVMSKCAGLVPNGVVVEADARAVGRHCQDIRSGLGNPRPGACWAQRGVPSGASRESPDRIGRPAGRRRAAAITFIDSVPVSASSRRGPAAASAPGDTGLPCVVTAAGEQRCTVARPRDRWPTYRRPMPFSVRPRQWREAMPVQQIDPAVCRS